ncbi:DNA polymerase III, subunit gamma and tau [Candidatus Adlerbacteria bacterium RIFOXYC1_FULL_48_26]|uniref:DNA polymerase III subunit gamma/tau n=1 Tax=Candidatus Adlerbacteria bacterium RIFOXYC1_FULL_48_26 TaxID=1797247 RepID=A0A1F4Y3A0_9BACT|nr:MAG: DNA polymerase III, subunit gamma and tau [Candidatus Adlerbacteria bacterium RIFOXYC1_FULL_48_26]OGC94181.1 MAG: DNA polymerase III, subunit gamma and tau [Candidatus Adlerbacteria bacterium RIFOXYB1_FULL_48_10]OGC95735.1 MAG: DNA polymerase III, subunit gamma and tau [Candidatus Adlerbacteria bacterium RIFOXYD1_FULL_48_8]
MAKTSTPQRTPLALYRKYRPAGFSEFRDQDTIVAVLTAAVEQKKIAHAYLFAGGRGTGKTSMARALAHSVDTTDNDIYEMDAASNRGIDEIRELREGVATLPFESTYKFYIIDEAHALTGAAWGALLKTLEEPPEHVVFVLATTELDKVPETIRSRCQVFQFKNPSHETLKKLVLDVAKKEGGSITPAGAELVALMGDGSFRDTLGILQKVLTISDDKKLSEEEVARVVGAPSSKTVNEFLEALAEKDMAKALKTFHAAIAGGTEPKVFTLLSLAKIRAVLLIRFAPDLKKELGEQFSEDDIKTLSEFAGPKGAAINAALLSELITALLDMNRAPIPAIPLELALYRVFGA